MHKSSSSSRGVDPALRAVRRSRRVGGFDCVIRNAGLDAYTVGRACAYANSTPGWPHAMHAVMDMFPAPGL
jgi:hypothetical protein